MSQRKAAVRTSDRDEEMKSRRDRGAGGRGNKSSRVLSANGVEILAESFVNDSVINLGSDLGPNIDLTLSVIDGPGGAFAVGGAVPEPSTWAMMLFGFAGLAWAGYRRASRPRNSRALEGDQDHDREVAGTTAPPR
jgi:hypothetical protein